MTTYRMPVAKQDGGSGSDEAVAAADEIVAGAEELRKMVGWGERTRTIAIITDLRQRLFALDSMIGRA